ncbi:MAG: hypothetical protein ACRDZX_00530, partial [Acidimicrobiales bacterium]
AQGREVARALSTGPVAGAAGTSRQISSIASSAATTYKAVLTAGSPAGVATGAGLLEASLAARKDGAAQVASAVRSLLGDGPTSAAAKRSAEQAAVRRIGAAFADFQVSDNAYRLFSRGMPRLGVTMPTSSWAGATRAYQPKSVTVFANRLLAARPPASPRQLAIEAVSTVPEALSAQGGTQVLSPAGSLSVTVVVTDVGQSAQDHVQVWAVIAPVKGAPEQREAATVGLSPGQSEAVTLKGLEMVPSTPTRLTVGAQGRGGAAARASTQVRVEVPGAKWKGVTATAPTTAVPSSSTTST